MLKVRKRQKVKGFAIIIISNLNRRGISNKSWVGGENIWEREIIIVFQRGDFWMKLTILEKKKERIRNEN